MFSSIRNILDELSPLEYEIALTLVGAAVIFLVAAILIYFLKAKMNRVFCRVVFVFFFVFMIAFIAAGVVISVNALKPIENGFVKDVGAVYTEMWFNVLHIVVLLLLLACCMLLIMPAEKKKEQVAISPSVRQKSFFDDYDEAAEDDGLAESYTSGDYFKEFGNNENDVTANIDRMTKKLQTQPDGELSRSRELFLKVDAALDNESKPKKAVKRNTKQKNADTEKKESE